MKKILTFAIIAIVILGGIYYFANKKLADTGYSSFMNGVVALNAISATTTSSAININGASRATISFNVDNVPTAGVATSTFVVTVSADGTNYVTYNKLIDNVANANSQNLTRVASVAIDSETTKIYSMDLEHDVFKSMKITDTILGTTTSSVTATVLLGY